MGTRPQVFIGGDNSPGFDPTGAGVRFPARGAWPGAGIVKQYLDGENGWRWVQQNVDGYFFALQQFHSDDSWMLRMANILTNKNAFVETDFAHSDRGEDEAWMAKVASQGFSIKYAAMNKNDGHDDGVRHSLDRVNGLKQHCNGPVLAMGGPFSGDDGTLSWGPWSNAINDMDGSATDGPVGLWAADHHGMRGRTRQSVFYAHGLSKTAMVMLAPYTSGTGADFLRWGQHCVRWLEIEGAVPDIWVISYYASEQRYNVTPEKNHDGSPAGTVTGMAYWLINHLRESFNISVYPHTFPALHAQWRERGNFDGYVLLREPRDQAKPSSRIR